MLEMNLHLLSQQTEPFNQHSMRRRGKAGIRKPKVYNVVHNDTNLSESEPLTVDSALLVPHWKNAMLFELGALNNNNTWSLTTPPEGRKIVGSHWIFKVKRHSDGSVAWYKV